MTCLVITVRMHVCSGYIIILNTKGPSDRQSRKTSSFACVKVMMAGPKNMHSSSGCAVIRRTFPSVFNDLFPLIHLSSETTKTDTKPIERLTTHNQVRTAIKLLNITADRCFANSVSEN